MTVVGQGEMVMMGQGWIDGCRGTRMVAIMGQEQGAVVGQGELLTVEGRGW